MGLTNFPGSKLKKEDVTVGKNYLDEPEINQLNRLVNQYLEFAELQAMRRKPMYMATWIEKLHGFLTLNDREILTNAGKVSKADAEKYALREYEKFRTTEAKRLDESEEELDRAMKMLQSKKP